MSYILTVHFNNSFHEIFLSGLNNRKITVDIPTDISGCSSSLPISLEVWNDSWEILENDLVEFLQTGEHHHSVELTAGLSLSCAFKPDREKFAILVEEIFAGYSDFDKFLLKLSKITIGSNNDNSIIYNNRNLVSARHALIERDSAGGYSIIDLDSSNGTFVNGRRIKGKNKLCFGDSISIFGMKIIYLGDLLAVNHPKSQVIQNGFELYVKPNEENEAELFAAETGDYYQRSPRQIEFMDGETIEIEAPPSPNRSQRQPLMFTVGPAMTMVIPMAAGVMFTVWSAQQTSVGMASPFMFMGIITSITAAFIGVFWAMANYKYSRKTEKLEEERRSGLYRKYLEKMRRLLTKKHLDNKNLLDHKYPETAECLRFIRTNSRRLWERNVNHLDFLTIRLGKGAMNAPNQVDIPKERFSLLDDDLAEEPFRIKSEFLKLKDVPVSFSLQDHLLTGVIGNGQEACANIGRIMAAQIASYHSYTDVRMVFIYNEKNAADYEFAKWLPHTWSADESLRMMACDANGIGEVCYHLASVLRERSEEGENQRDKARKLPHYIVFISNPNLVEKEGVMKYLSSPTEQMGLSTILLYDQIGRLPNNCSIIIQNDDEYKGYYSLDNSFASYPGVIFDPVPELALIDFARDLSGIRVREMQSAGAIPQVLTFLDMYKTTRAEDLDVQRRWLENRTYESMKAMIGYRGADAPMYLDIHEKYHGPHGLVAGTTGSGKSETLQTYILSLALNYHPHEVSFILIDYKGGGMAGSFENLPHVAGIITNLGGNQTNRALASINSEIKRRQSIFNEYKIKHIDTYIELYRSGKTTAPLPHLLIIADEFAELKKEQPEFVRELVSASRVGRSLGVHLILATQKPSGVVDDEIWGNSKFRLCLRVQDKQDSNEMIKRPDAAYITNAGRGFFQVGNDEIFEAFQSGWSGAKYEPETEYSDAKQVDAKMINLWGKERVVGGGKKVAPALGGERRKSQLEAVVDHIIETAAAQQIKVIDRIWLPPLPEIIILKDIPGYKERAYDNGVWLISKGELNPIAGIVDDPVNQRQRPLSIDLLTEGHVLITASSSGGKTTFLQTLLYSLVTCWAPNQVHIYIADFGSRTMGVFASLPHVGGIAFENETDKVDKLMAMLIKELNRRKLAFSSKGIGSYKEYIRLYDDVPAIIFAIDNYASFTENCQKQEDNMVMLSREASSYGIYLVITCSNANDIRYKIRQNFGYGIGMQLADRFEYEAALNAKCDFMAEDHKPGRGIVCCPKPLEFQTALCQAAQDAVMLNIGLKERFTVVAQAWTGEVAPTIPQVPADMSLDTFLQTAEVAALLGGGRYMPIGYDLAEAALEKINLAKTFCYSISGTSRSGKTNMLKVFMQMAKKMDGRIFVFDNNLKEIETYCSQTGIEGYLSTDQELFDLMKNTIVPEFTHRNQRKHEFMESGRKIDDSYFASEQNIFIFINDMAAFCETVYGSQLDMKGFMEQMAIKGDQHMIHLFACVPPTDVNGDFGSKKLFRAFIGWKEGLHLGGDVEHQRLFDFEVPVMERSKKLPAGIANIIVSGKTKRIVTPEA